MDLDFVCSRRPECDRLRSRTINPQIDDKSGEMPQFGNIMQDSSKAVVEIHVYGDSVELPRARSTRTNPCTKRSGFACNIPSRVAAPWFGGSPPAQ
jgi:hypothetical protein